MDIPSLDELKAALGLFRTAIGLAKDSRDLLPDGKEKEVVTQTLEEAEKAALIAEASIAQAFGYELCKCEFPPTPMLRIGYLEPHGDHDIDYVYECPKCKQNTAGAWAFTRQVGENP